MLGVRRQSHCWGAGSEQLDQAGCEAVLVNTHYLAEQVEALP